MLTSKVAKRYAQGLLEFTNECGQTATVFSEMKDVKKLMSESEDLNKFFKTPYIDAKKKVEVAKEIFKGLSPVSQNLITLVIKHVFGIQKWVHIFLVPVTRFTSST